MPSLFHNPFYSRLPTSSSRLPELALDDSESEPDAPFLQSELSLPRPAFAKSTNRRKWTAPLLASVGTTVTLALFIVLLILPRRVSSKVDHSEYFAAAARNSVADLRDRQSRTLAQATARYTLKTGRQPPRNYDRWFQFAQEHKCLIDDYDQIHRDFKPFYQLAEDDPAFFQRMIDAAAVMNGDNRGLGRWHIQNGNVEETSGTSVAYSYYWQVTLGKFAHILPDLTVVINARDQPRVVFDVRQTGKEIRERARKLTEKTPFNVSPKQTQTYFAGQPGCTILRNPDGFPDVASDDSAFLLSSAMSQFTEDLYPILSMAKIGPCFADILFPIEYYYQRSWWYRKFSYANNIPWDRKKAQLYWRGIASGGQIVDSNYHNFTRFRLVDLARKHPDLINGRITSFADELCSVAVCDKAKILKEYDITGERSQKEDAYGYKYLLDLDGTTFSGRFLGLLRSGSLVFKMTVFQEYFNDWLRPYEHYIPVASDLSDLTEKLAWAKENEVEARMIQERGREMAERVVTDEQNDCYFSLVLLEWARLQEMARTNNISTFR
ncbi:CAP10 domain-containing protein [Mycena indigotica]|uniref:CAP10 domain-containing protein n=1 Tax=Mycena indigotica TaxID=2126181 RepID=A0A8H6W619_9AGAR|nr:CAP10 domain-containing protein [Mycena indigotica]KAF7306227.1 CAP10 domain-containing protein [Mycena indigotica]